MGAMKAQTAKHPRTWTAEETPKSWVILIESTLYVSRNAILMVFGHGGAHI